MSVFLFVAAMAACGNDDAIDDGVGDDRTEPTTGLPPGGTDPDPLELVDAPAPLGLGMVRLPESAEGVDAVFEVLPVELLGVTRRLEAVREGQAAAVYEMTERTCATSALRAMDLGAAGEGFFPPGWTAEWEVARFATGADWHVDSAGRDGELTWVQWHTTCGGDGVENSEVYVTTWGSEGGAWVFAASSDDAESRDTLVAAFVAATPRRDTVDSIDNSLARQALLRRSDVGADWVSQPRFEEDDPAGDDLAETVFEAEPACASLVGYAAQQGIQVADLIDAIGADAPSHAESPTYTYRLDGTSEVEHTVSVYATAADVTETFSLLRDLAWPDCVRAVFDDLLRARYEADGVDVTITDYSATQTPIAIGDDGIRIRITLGIQPPQGAPAELTFNLSGVAIGRAISGVSQLSLDAAIEDPDSLAASAHGKVEAIFG